MIVVHFRPLRTLLIAVAVGCLVLAGAWVEPAFAANLSVGDVSLEPCPSTDIGAQPQLRRPSGASCSLTGDAAVSNRPAATVWRPATPLCRVWTDR